MKLTPIELRHQLHKIPELMFKEFQTTSLLLDAINELPVIKIHRPLDTGLIVEYTVNNGDYLLFRADIDALPIKEETGITFASTNQNMHACGHDVHSSILYGFLNYVVESKINKNIIFIFQPAEEGGGGAEKIILSEILNQFNIKNAFALHVTDEYPVGTIASTAGVLFATALEINVEFIGKSAHIAFPEEGKNAFNALRIFFDEADKIPVDKTHPFLLGLGKIYSGTARNILPSSAFIEGTIRSLESYVSEELIIHLKNILKKIKDKTGVDFSFSKGSFYKEVLVDQDLFNNYYNVLSNIFKFIDCGYKMTGEDFGYFSHLYPSFMFWLGTSTGERYGLHHPKFLPDDSIIGTGINAFKEILNNEIS
jgi:N-acetyldiaminopimelate deacetylase